MTFSIVLPWSPFDERTVDEEFERDADALSELFLKRVLVDHDSLNEAPRFRPVHDLGGKGIYRGWMVTVDSYTKLYEALKAKGIQLITSPEGFASSHYITGWIEAFEGLTPRTVTVPVNASSEDIIAAAMLLGVTSFIVKDYVKSRKNEWDTACYSPTLESLPTVAQEFIRLQDDFFVGELVIREFVKLDKTKPELRIWWTNGDNTLVTLHPDSDSDAIIPGIPEDFIRLIKERVQHLGNPFLTTDIAAKEDGSWIMIEAGDGQVSGFPKTITPEEIEMLFSALSQE